MEVPEDGWQDHAGDLTEDQRDLAGEITDAIEMLHDETTEADGRTWPFRFEFDDAVRLLAGDDAIDALESSLPGHAGVRAALHLDREVLLVDVDQPEAVHGWVVAELARTASPEDLD